MQNSIVFDALEKELFNYLKAKIGSNDFKDWFSKAYISYDNNYYLNLPNFFVFEWVMRNYNYLIEQFSEKNGLKIQIRIFEKQEIKTEKNETKPVLSNNFLFENFVTGKTNQMAYEAAYRVAKSDEILFNPLFIYGNVGLGKTHLLNAIVNYKKIHFPNKKILYLSAEQFMNTFVRAIQNDNITNFKNDFRSADILLIDDFQFLSSKQGTQEEFFHTFNTLFEEKKQVIITADKAPNELPAIEHRIKSRLGWGLCIDIHPPTYELKLGILHKKLEAFNLSIDNESLEVIANASESIRELEGLLTKIINYAEWMSQPINKEFVQSLCVQKQKEIKTDMQIIEHILKNLNVTLTQVQSQARTRDIVRARQMIVYILRKLKGISYLNIGKLLGNKDHTSIMYAEKQANILKTSDLGFSTKLNEIEKNIDI